MPIYEYECEDDNCRHRFEKLECYGREPFSICPECGNSAHRVISVSAPKKWKPSEETKQHKVGNHNIPIRQGPDGLWRQVGLGGGDHGRDNQIR